MCQCEQRKIAGPFVSTRSLTGYDLSYFSACSRCDFTDYWPFTTLCLKPAVKK